MLFAETSFVVISVIICSLHLDLLLLHIIAMVAVEEVVRFYLCLA